MTQLSAPRLLVTTPFGLGVRDDGWLQHRLRLISAITAPSLLAQRDQEFYWALFVDPGLPSQFKVSLEELLEPFGGRASLIQAERREYRANRTLECARALGLDRSDGAVLTGILDDDDAWSRDVVGVVRDRVERWEFATKRYPGVGISFEYGFEWLMYDMVDVDLLQHQGRRLERPATVRPYRFPFLGTSVFIFAPLSEGMAALSAGHSRMPALLEKRGFDVDIVNTREPMWLYCRHKQAGSGIQKSKEQDVARSLEELAAQFGLNEGLTRRYIASADGYDYGVVKRLWRYRTQVEGELRDIEQRLRDPGLCASDAEELRRNRETLRDDLEQASTQVVGGLTDTDMNQPRLRLDK